MDPGFIALRGRPGLCRMPPILDSFATVVWHCLLRQHGVYALAMKSVDASSRSGPTLMPRPHRCAHTCTFSGAQDDWPTRISHVFLPASMSEIHGFRTCKGDLHGRKAVGSE